MGQRAHFYDLLVEDYDRMVDTPARVARELPAIVALLREAGTKTVLEVGCATGAHAVALGREGFEVLGIDPTPGFIERARRQPDLPAGVAFEESTLDQWAPQVKVPFDALLCIGHTFPHLLAMRPMPNLVQIMAHVLRPGGLLVVQMLNPGLIEGRGVWAPPMRSWRDGDGEVTLLRQWVDNGDTLQMVVTRVRSGGGPQLAMGSSWEQRLPKIRAAQMRAALEEAGWTDIAVRDGWSEAEFNEATSESMVVLAKRP